MRVIHKKNSKIVDKIINHTKDNLKAYLLVAIILLIGITLGVLFVNNLQEQQSQEVQSYVNNYV